MLFPHLPPPDSIFYVVCPCCDRVTPVAGRPGEKATCWFCGAPLNTGVLVVIEECHA